MPSWLSSSLEGDGFGLAGGRLIESILSVFSFVGVTLSIEGDLWDGGGGSEMESISSLLASWGLLGTGGG